MKVFDDYVSNYDMGIDGINLKYHHSYRVQKIEEEIAKSLDMNEKDFRLASLCGLFHDIARFEQYTKYHTFEDRKSIDHGDFGYQILKDGLIKQLNLDEEDENVLLLSTKYHNKYEIDKSVKGRELTFCKMIRDADKIDILELFSNQAIRYDLLNGNDKVSKECENDFMGHKQVNWKNVKTEGDRILMFLAFIWDFNFKKTFEIISNKGLYNTIKDVINLPSFDKYFQMIDDKIKEELK